MACRFDANCGIYVRKQNAKSGEARGTSGRNGDLCSDNARLWVTYTTPDCCRSIPAAFPNRFRL